MFLGCHSKIPETGWLKEEKFVFSQFWILGVLDQGASMVSFWWEPSSWLADRWFSCCVLLMAFLGACQGSDLSFFSYKANNPSRLVSSFMTSFNLNYPLKGLPRWLSCQSKRHRRHSFDLWRSPGGGNGNSLQYSCLEGYSPWGHKEMDITEWLGTEQHPLKTLWSQQTYSRWELLALAYKFWEDTTQSTAVGFKFFNKKEFIFFSSKKTLNYPL